MKFFSTKKPNNRTKYFAALVVAIFIFGVAANFIAIRPAKAQFATAATTVADIPRILEKIKDNVLLFVEKAANIVYKNALNYYLQRIAYDTATYLATGDKGQQPLFWDQGVGGYLRSIGDEAIGGALEEFANDTFGISLCQPISANVELQLILSAKRTQEPSRPTCTFSEIARTRLLNVTVNGETPDLRLLDQSNWHLLADYFRPQSNELGMSMILKSNLQTRKAKDEELARLIRQLEPDIKSLTSPIGKLGEETIKTPALAQSIAFTKSIGDALSLGQTTLTGDPVADAISTFTNTFASKFLQRLQRGLLSGSNNRSGPQDFLAGSSYATQGAKAQFADFIVPTYRGGGTLDVLGEISSCPPDSRGRLYTNCLIDSNLATAIDQQMTVRQAVEQGYLDLSKPFGFLSDGSEPDWQNGYPYRSLVFLRKYRVIPVTWELSALYNRDFDSSQEQKTLAQLMGTPQNNYQIFDDEDSPYYHMIDPNWVLKMPSYQCQARGAGPQVLERVKESFASPDGLGGTIQTTIDTLQRADYCADERTCIVENSNGTCQQYGYCTKEKETWRFDGDSCPANQTSCETYANSKGQKNSYLVSTLATCNNSQVGCRWYSAWQTASGLWAEDIWNSSTNSYGQDSFITFNDVYQRTDLGNRSYVRHFNDQVETCSASDRGCSQLLSLNNIAPPDGYESTPEAIYQYVMANADSYEANATYRDTYGEWAQISQVSLKLPPAYLNCTADLTDPNRDPECDRYALLCLPEEAGCQLYTPLNGDPPVPGVLSENDYCSQSCVGYDQYLEETTYFDSVFDPDANPTLVNLIPATAQSCRANQVGCEEFTNLDEIAQGGEGIEYFTYIRECILPDDPGAKIFYTWEGSDTTGYQLKTWRLGTSGQGPTGQTCDPNNDPLNCRVFIDSTGSTYPRDIITVVFATDDCHPYRRSQGGQTIYGIKSLSQSCQAAAVSCREYRGNQGNVVNIILNDDFESGTNENWFRGTNSSQSVYVGGHSLAVNNISTKKRVNSLINQNKNYTLSFWARSQTGSTNLRFSIQQYGDNNITRSGDWLISGAFAQTQVELEQLVPIAGTDIQFEDVSLTEDWQYYKVGPITFDRVPGAYEFLQTNSGSFYLDNIILREVTDSYYLLKDSWNTPALCDQPYQGAQLGCQAYSSNQAGTVNLLGFTSLCSDQKVGCQALVATHESDSPFSRDFNTNNNSTTDPQGLDDITVPQDDLLFVVNDPGKQCSSQFQGCELLGEAVIDRQSDQGQVLGFNDRFLVDNPQRYEQTLCGSAGLYCDRYTNERTGATAYFINPGSQACEYKVLSGQTSANWYKTGTEDLCDLGYVCANDLTTSCQTSADCGGAACIVSSPGQPIPSDSDYFQGWAGLCQADNQGCSQYLDPEGEKVCTDTGEVCQTDSDCSNALCRPSSSQSAYYYLEQSIDGASCNGLVDRDRGCRLFDKTDGYPLSYTDAAYSSSLTANGSTPETSPDPLLNDSNIILQVEKDRVCREWLACRTRVENYDEEGNRSDKCLDVALCQELDENGQCADFIDLPEPPQNIEGLQQAGTSGDMEEIRYLTGYSKAGMSWQGFSQGDGTIPGYWNYQQMSQLGQEADVLYNPGFEEIFIPQSGLESPFAGWQSEVFGCNTATHICSISSTNQSAQGATAAHISISPNEGGNNQIQDGLALQQEIEIGQGEFVLSGYAKWQKADAGGSVHVFIRDISGNNVLGSYTFTANNRLFSQSWERFAFSFTSNIKDITISLEIRAVNSGEVSFDDLQIMPALEVNDQGLLVGQTCRMYPRGDAPECNYQKEGKTYIGWPGYCVEPDPRNPAYCVNWWPVDIVQGSLASLNETSLTFGEKVPLYYCALAQGNHSSNINYLNYSHNDYKYTVNRGAREDENYGYFYTRESSQGCHDYRGLDNTSFAIGGCSRNGTGSWGAVVNVTTTPEANLNEYMIDRIEFIKVSNGPEYPSKVVLDRRTRLSKAEAENLWGNSPRVLTNGMLETDFIWSADCHWKNDSDGTSRDFDLPVDGICGNSSNPSGANDYLHVGVIFNDQGQPKGYYIDMNDLSGQNNEAAGYKIVYYLREVCKQVVKVADTLGNGQVESYPFWSRLQSLSGYSVSDLLYSYQTDSAPFGSAYQSGLAQYNQAFSNQLQDESDPTTWDSRPFEPGNQPLYVEAFNPLGQAAINPGPNIRAGTPYACEGNCSESICSGGTRNSQVCLNDDTARSCFQGSGQDAGVCVGSWQTSSLLGNNTSQAIGKIQELFANFLGNYQWTFNVGTSQWEYSESTIPGSWDIRETGVIPQIPDMWVGSRDGGSQVVLQGEGTVKLSFTSQINDNQLPLRSYSVDWGDGTPPTTISGYFAERPNPGDPHILYHSYSGVNTYSITVTIKDNWDRENSRTLPQAVIVNP